MNKNEIDAEMATIQLAFDAYWESEHGPNGKSPVPEHLKQFEGMIKIASNMAYVAGAQYGANRVLMEIFPK